MKQHTWHALGWLIWGVASVGFFAIWEYIALRDPTDDRQPLTFFIRKGLGDANNPLWWLFLGFVLWLGFHFLIRHNA